MQQHPGTLCSILCLTEHCLSSSAAVRPHPCWTMTPPPHPTSTSSSWAHSGWGRRVNCEWGRPTTRANKSTEPLFSWVKAQQWTAGGSHEYLIDGVREAGVEGGGGGEMKSGLRVNAETLKKWWMTGEKFGRNWKNIYILRHYIRDLKVVREGELGEQRWQNAEPPTTLNLCWINTPL